MFGWGKKEKPVPTMGEGYEAAVARSKEMDAALAAQVATEEAEKAARVPKLKSFTESVEAYFGNGLHPKLVKYMVGIIESKWAASDAKCHCITNQHRYDELAEMWALEYPISRFAEMAGYGHKTYGEEFFTEVHLDFLRELKKEYTENVRRDFEVKNPEAIVGITNGIFNWIYSTLATADAISEGMYKTDAMFAEGDGYDELFEKVVNASRDKWAAELRPALFDLPPSTAVTLEKVLRGFAMSEELRQPSLWHVWARTPHGDNIKEQIRRQVLEQHVDGGQTEELDALRKQITRLESAIMAAGIDIPKF